MPERTLALRLVHVAAQLTLQQRTKNEDQCIDRYSLALSAPLAPAMLLSRRAEVLDLYDKIIDIPGTVFGDHTPGSIVQ